MPPLHFKEKLFEGKMKSSTKLTKQFIGEILTKRNDEIMPQDENQEQIIREKNATVSSIISKFLIIQSSRLYEMNQQKVLKRRKNLDHDPQHNRMCRNKNAEIVPLRYLLIKIYKKINYRVIFALICILKFQFIRLELSCCIAVI